MFHHPEKLTVRVKAVRWESDGVLSFEFVAADGGRLPPFTAGAHVDLHLPNELVRSYSLCGDQEETHRWIVAVNRDAHSRGGSTWIHDHLHAGQFLTVSEPLNNFPLAEDAGHSVLIAGGIGITPMVSMVRRLASRDRDWTVYLAVRTRGQAAFVDELRRLAGERPERLVLHVDDENGGQVLDVASIVSGVDDDTHVYCCGPAPMLDAFEKAAAHLPEQRRHVEYFAAKEAPATDGGFEVELTYSGVVLRVPEGATILDTLLAAGVDAPFSCTEGVCGTCETRVLGGIPDHRDLVLTDAEKESNDVMMICCSGSKSARLVLER